MIRFLFTLLVIAVFSPSVSAHTLGVDKALLVEMAGGEYRLVSKVPPAYQHLIISPELPERCQFLGNPSGERGLYEVRFSFRCATKLTAGDRLILPWEREGVMLTVEWNGEVPITKLSTRQGTVISVDLIYYRAGSGSFLAAAERYTKLGIEHILEGVDHLFFVLGLMLLVSGPWILLKTITGFTVAHSMTLALSTLGFVKLPSGPVEAAIALSIVFLAVEIVKGYRGQFSIAHRKPWLIAFIFGLLHGLGFAGALSEIGLPTPEIPVALLFFNIGVEIGQILFVAVVIAFAWAWKRLPAKLPGWAELVPVYLLGTVSTYWFIERTTAMFIAY